MYVPVFAVAINNCLQVTRSSFSSTEIIEQLPAT